jgi:hypothetical protein
MMLIRKEAGKSSKLSIKSLIPDVEILEQPYADEEILLHQNQPQP